MKQTEWLGVLPGRHLVAAANLGTHRCHISLVGLGTFLRGGRNFQHPRSIGVHPPIFQGLCERRLGSHAFMLQPVQVAKGPKRSVVLHFKMRVQHARALWAVQPPKYTSATIVDDGNPEVRRKGVDKECIGVVQEAQVARNEGDFLASQCCAYRCG